MSTVVFWAIVGAVLALRLTPLWGIIAGIVAAVIGMAVPVGMVATSGTVLLGSIGNTRAAPGFVSVARDFCIVVFAACAVMLFAVIHAVNTGSMPLSGSRSSSARRPWMTGRR